jgi:hypothetical protein
MVPGYVQGGTRPPPECPERPFGEVLYSGNLWVPEVLVQGFEGATPNPASFLA